MRSLTWDRQREIRKLRSHIWKYLSPAVSFEEEQLQAAALLQLPESDVLTLATIHFLLAEEVARLVRALPHLLRRLSTTSATQEEASAERIRGPILWNKTFAARGAGGTPSWFVTAPARRAFQTPENELLVFVLDEIVRLGRGSEWMGRLGTPARELSDRVESAERWRSSRMLLQVERKAPTPRSFARIRSGRFRRSYEAVIAAYSMYLALISHLDRSALRRAVEEHAFVVSSNARLFEIACAFAILDCLEELGWTPSPLGLFGQTRSLHSKATRDGELLHLWYQATPKRLIAGSKYRAVQRAHAFSNASIARPDFVLLRREGGRDHWLLVEVKMGDDTAGEGRTVEGSARAALKDLLAYRRDFDETLGGNDMFAYGLGIAWGAELDPAPSEIMLCTPDRLLTAIGNFVGAAKT